MAIIGNSTTGDDIIIGDEIGNFIDALAGNDSVEGRGGNDILIGGLGRDTLAGGQGSDALFGGKGSDSIRGGAGDDQLTGAVGNDTLRGGLGNDLLLESRDVNFSLTDAKLEVKAANNLTVLETDNLFSIERAQLSGGDSGNFIGAQGFSGQATLLGFGGNDVLTGGSESDVLNGGDGLDVLNGFEDVALTSERDQLTGGADSDLFVIGFNVSVLQRVGYSDFGDLDFATLTDFSAAEGDRIRVGKNLSDYSLDKTQSISGVGSSAIDTRIFHKNELIAVVQDNTNVSINRDFVI